MHAYFRELTTPPPPLTRGQKLLLGVLFAVVAVSRRYALAKSPLDWDESLLAGGVRAYDVVAEHPHAPGYPLFILFAKLVRLVVPDDFHSLQAVASIASLLLFPATFYLLRELRFRFRVAIAGAVITVFLPTVWYYGGTALSDVPALCAVVIASALLLAGGRNPRAWIAGMIVAGIAGGIRPMHIVIAAIPAVASALAHRRRRTIVIGCTLFAAVIVASYAGAAFASENPPWGYLHMIARMAGHIGGTDSFHNAHRAPLRQLASTYFVTSHRGGWAGLALLALAAIGAAEGVIRRRVNAGIVAAMFVPIAVASWMMLDTTAVTRYGLAYVMLYSVLGAYGIDVLARVVPHRITQTVLVAVAAALLVVPMIGWTRPALYLVRHQVSPPIAAMRWIRGHVPRAGPSLWLTDNLHFHAGHELAGYDVRYFSSERDIPAEAYVAGNYCLVDWLTFQPHARTFAFPRTRLAEIARVSFFETAVVPMAAMIRFGDGWYQDEWDEERLHSWRWMQQSSVMLLPPLPSNGALRLAFHVPVNALPRPPKLTILWNGTAIDQLVCTDFEIERRYVLVSRGGSANECRILLDETAESKGDPRHFGLQLVGLSWERTDGLPYGF